MLKAYQQQNIQNFPLEVNPFFCTFAIVTEGCSHGTASVCRPCSNSLAL